MKIPVLDLRCYECLSTKSMNLDLYACNIIKQGANSSYNDIRNHKINSNWSRSALNNSKTWVSYLRAVGSFVEDEISPSWKENKLIRIHEEFFHSCTMETCSLKNWTGQVGACSGCSTNDIHLSFISCIRSDYTIPTHSALGSCFFSSNKTLKQE